MVSRKLEIPSGRLVAGPRFQGQCSSSWTCATASSLVQPWKSYQPPSASGWLECRKSPTSKRLRELRATIRGLHCWTPTAGTGSPRSIRQSCSKFRKGRLSRPGRFWRSLRHQNNEKALAMGRQSKHNHKRVNNKSFSQPREPGVLRASTHRTHKTEPLIRPAIGGLARETP